MRVQKQKVVGVPAITKFNQIFVVVLLFVVMAIGLIVYIYLNAQSRKEVVSGSLMLKEAPVSTDENTIISPRVR